MSETEGPTDWFHREPLADASSYGPPNSDHRNPDGNEEFNAFRPSDSDGDAFGFDGTQLAADEAKPVPYMEWKLKEVLISGGSYTMATTPLSIRTTRTLIYRRAVMTAA